MDNFLKRNSRITHINGAYHDPLIKYVLIRGAKYNGDSMELQFAP